MKKISRGLANIAIDLQTQPPRALSKRRIAELLERSRDVINAVGTDSFKAFSRRYSNNVREALQLFREIHKKGTIVVDLDPYVNLVAEGHLSLYAQLEQVWARWRVHQWIAQNREFIAWLSRRRDFYPLLLAHAAGTMVQLPDAEDPIMLPTVNMVWLIDLVTPFVVEQFQEHRIAAVLSNPQHHDALLTFAAQLPQISVLAVAVGPLVDRTIAAMMKVVSANRPFFSCVILNEGFSNHFLHYVTRGNQQANVLMRTLMGYRRELSQLVELQNHELLFTDRELFLYFRPLINVLLAAHLSGRLAMLLDIAKINAKSLSHCHGIATVLTWLESHRAILTETTQANSEWHRWLVRQPGGEQALAQFSMGLFELLNSGQCKDVRPGKSDQSTFPSAAACYLDAFSGLEAEQRGSELFCFPGDVLLFKFLTHKDNFRVVEYIGCNNAAITALFTAYRNYQAQQLNAMAPAVIPVLQDQTNAAVTAEFEPGYALRKGPLLPKALVFNNDDAENLGQQPVVLGLF